jgi:negative regulator of genetic competence, sporulation and motility
MLVNEKGGEKMEWIRISQNKLKIMLSAQDTAHYALDCKKADGSDEGSRAAFREILSDVQRETGFEAAEDKVYIQMYPSKEGGCELFVTRIGLLLSDGSAPARPKAVRSQEKRRRTGCDKALYFTELESLLLLCRRLSLKSQIEKSQLWRDEQGGWWLLVANASACPALALREFGSEIPHERAALYLTEHGTCLCKKEAVQLLSKL